MSEAYHHTQTQVCAFLQEHYGLSDVEANIILDDILLNLEAMAADWNAGQERQCPPEWQRDRIAAAVLALGQNAKCDRLVGIGEDLSRAVKEQEDGPEALSQLREFIDAMRKAIPTTHRTAIR